MAKGERPLVFLLADGKSDCIIQQSQGFAAVFLQQFSAGAQRVCIAMPGLIRLVGHSDERKQGTRPESTESGAVKGPTLRAVPDILLKRTPLEATVVFKRLHG